MLHGVFSCFSEAPRMVRRRCFVLQTMEVVTLPFHVHCESNRYTPGVFVKLAACQFHRLRFGDLALAIISARAAARVSRAECNPSKGGLLGDQRIIVRVGFDGEDL